MGATSQAPGKSTQIAVGNRCLLNVMNRHFMAEIQEVNDDNIRVTFPGKDYPIPGMQVDMEFHDVSGFSYYRTSVFKGPSRGVEGIVLGRPRELKRFQHRESCRVGTDLTVQLKDQVHIRKYDAAVVNISSKGLLARSEAPLAFNATVEVTMSLPGEPSFTVLGQVVHTAGGLGGNEGPGTFFGIRFLDLEPDVENAVSRYIWRRLKELYPSQ